MNLLLDHIKILSPQGSDGDNEQHRVPGTPENLIDEDFGDCVDYIQPGLLVLFLILFFSFFRSRSCLGTLNTRKRSLQPLQP